MRLITGGGAGGKSARRLLPAAVPPKLAQLRHALAELVEGPMTVR